MEAPTKPTKVITSKMNTSNCVPAGTYIECCKSEDGRCFTPAFTSECCKILINQ